jgi:hypothetical protein
MSRGRPYLHFLLLDSKLCLEVSERAVLRADERDETEELFVDNKNEIIYYVIVTKFLNS